MGPPTQSHHRSKIFTKLKNKLRHTDRHGHDGGPEADAAEHQTASSDASVAGKTDQDNITDTNGNTSSNGNGDDDVPAPRIGGADSSDTACMLAPDHAAQIRGTDNKDPTMPKEETPAHKTIEGDHADAAGNSPPEFTHNILWNEAYQQLNTENKRMIDAYEKIISRVFLKAESDKPQGINPDNVVAQDPSLRGEQMKKIVKQGLVKVEKAKRVTEGYGKFFQLVTPFKSVLDAGLQNVPQAALPWAVVSASLDILAKPAKVGDVLYTGVNQVVSRMSWYSSLSDKLLRSDDINGDRPLETSRLELKERILDLYKALLFYQIKSVCYFYRNQFWVFLRGFVELDDWSGDLKTVTDAEDALRRDSEQYNKEHIKLLLENMLIVAKDQADFQKKMEREKEEKGWLSDLYWIDPRDEVEGIKGRKDKLVDASYQWILATNEYKRFADWEESTGSNLLWINGQAGTGKTMLLIGIIQELMNQCLSDPNSPQVAYFFFQGTADQLNNGIGALRSLIWMLVLQQPHLISHLREVYTKSGYKAFENDDAFEKLSRIFKSMVEDERLEPVYLAIDAVDECYEPIDEKSAKGTRKSVTQLLKSLLSSQTATCKVKWLVSCRPLSEIESEMAGTSLYTRGVMDLDQKNLERPINYYIDYKVQQLREKGHEEKSLIDLTETLRQRAGNTFMWVWLICRELMGTRARVWPEILETVPDDLTELYRYLFKRIQSMKWKADSDDCIRILVAATVAPQPLKLSDAGLLAGLPSTEEAKQVVKLCGSFLMIRSDHVYLIHQSAQDYLRSQHEKMQAVAQTLGQAAIRGLGKEQKSNEVENALSMLWKSREFQRFSNTSVVLVVGLRLIMAHYYTGQPLLALSLAETISHNLRRLFGPRDPSTLGFMLLVSQMYTVRGQQNQSESEIADKEKARGYYQKAANVHMSILQAFAESYADPEEDESFDLDEQTAAVDIAPPFNKKLSTGEYIRRHLYLLKLALQRLGEPLNRDRYVALINDLFEMFPKELEGVEGFEEWDLKSYGAGKSEGTDDLLPSILDDWGFVASK